MFHKLDAVVRRFETLTERLGDPSLYDRAGELREINSERAHLEPIVNKYKEYKKTISDIEGNKDIIHNEKDEEMRELAKEELSELEKALPTIEHELKLLLLPRDPNDDRNVMIEIRAGAGGDEAGIFVGDVWRMYKNYFNSRGWRAEVVSISEGDVGIKELIANVSG
ncbi:MAG: PCRF domain-containing protein, partial [Bacteriovoracaceae bacterium]